MTPMAKKKHDWRPRPKRGAALVSYIDGHQRATRAQRDYIHGLYRRVHGHPPTKDEADFWRRMTKRRAGEMIDTLKAEEAELTAIAPFLVVSDDSPRRQDQNRLADVLADPRK